MKRINLLLALALLLTMAVMPAIAQQETPSAGSSASVSGIVVSSTESTLVLRTDTGDQMIFVVGASTPRPVTLAANDRVQVAYDLDPAGTMLASSITVQSAEGSASGSTSPSGAAYDSPSGSSEHQHETGTMGSTPSSATSSTPSSTGNLPATASPLPIIGLFGLIGVGAGILLRRRSKKAEA